MSALLWAMVVIAILGCVVMIVIAIVGTIENKNRRQAVTTFILVVAVITGLTCSTLFRFHHAIHDDDVVLPVETEAILEG